MKVILHLKLLISLAALDVQVLAGSSVTLRMNCAVTKMILFMAATVCVTSLYVKVISSLLNAGLLNILSAQAHTMAITVQSVGKLISSNM